MHIPDGYLSPTTCGVMGAAMVPVWTTAGRRVRKVVTSRYVPLLALGAAYSFLVMMFNVPIPDGTTAHAVGAVLIAILLGPWAAVVAVSVALAIQALFFGDGGVLSFGANCFNMAFVMPMVGYAVYRSTTRNVSLTSPRRVLRRASPATSASTPPRSAPAIEFGMQPTLFHTANGTPLYAPFHLSQTIPAMALAHLTVAGTVELVLTGRRDRVPAAREPPGAADQPCRRSRRRRRLPARASAGGGASIALGGRAPHPARAARVGRRVRRKLTERRYHLACDGRNAGSS